MSDVKIERGSLSSRELAVKLLAAARATDHPTSVVRKVTNGFLVPAEVADKAGFGKDEGKSEDKQQSPKPTKKTAAKKTANKEQTDG